MFPGFRRIIDSSFSFVFNVLNPNSFNLSGTWEYEYHEPSQDDPKKKVTEKEKVKITQIGNVIWATGETQKYKRTFKYKLTVTHNLIMGTYKKIGEKGATSGTGVIQLIVGANRNKLVGHATWMDADSNQLESDALEWGKIA